MFSFVEVKGKKVIGRDFFCPVILNKVKKVRDIFIETK